MHILFARSFISSCFPGHLHVLSLHIASIFLPRYLILWQLGFGAAIVFLMHLVSLISIVTDFALLLLSVFL